MNRNESYEHLFDQPRGIVRVIVDVNEKGGVATCLGPHEASMEAVFSACNVLAIMSLLENKDFLTEEGIDFVMEESRTQLMQIITNSGNPLLRMLGEFLAQIEEEEHKEGRMDSTELHDLNDVFGSFLSNIEIDLDQDAEE